MTKRELRALFVSANDGTWELRTLSAPNIVGPIDFAWSLGDQGKVYTTLGTGPLSGSNVPGSKRLVICGHSPQWDGFVPSTMGGAGLPWNCLGIDFVAISGKCEKPSVLLLRRTVEGGLELKFVALDPIPCWEGYGDEIGVHALLRKLHDEFADQLGEARCLAVGPASVHTLCGAIGSAAIRRGETSHVDTWAGRGGLGSRLWQGHGLCGVVYGGAQPAVEANVVLLDRLTEQRMGKPMAELVKEKTQKYRFDPTFKTGGTFGSNFYRLRERGLSFHYRSIEWNDDTRSDIHERLIEAHYLKQFQEEMADPKNHKTCGEPCPSPCKMQDGKFKKDFEPYQTLGPLVGVFDQRVAEKLARYVDACGFDAIQIGGTIAWLMEGMVEGWLPDDWKAAISDELPIFSSDGFDPVRGSEKNGVIARRCIDFVLYDANASSLRRGLRSAAEMLGGEALDAAVYNANGPAHGCLVPNQYWVPGMFAPIPVMGRYYMDYHYDWQPPFDLGRSCAERMAKELMLDNYGMCRFHRGWAEDILPEIVNETLGIPLDAQKHHLALAGGFQEFSGVLPWQTRRVKRMIATYLQKVREDGPRYPELEDWLGRFADDEDAASHAYWTEMREGFASGLTSATRKGN